MSCHLELGTSHSRVTRASQPRHPQQCPLTPYHRVGGEWRWERSFKFDADAQRPFRHTIEPMPDSPDNPLGAAGRTLGLGVREPLFEDGEQVRWEARANRFQHKIRAIGGRLYLTDRRLVFAPNKFEERVAGRAWSARLADLERAFVAGPMKTVRVVAHDGEEQRFVLRPQAESAATIDAAIQAAKPA